MFDLKKIEVTEFLKSISSGLILIDKNLEISFINSYAEKLFNFQGVDLIGKKLNRIIDNQTLIDSVKTSLNKNKEVSRHIFKIKINGNKHYIGFSTSILKTNSQIIGVLINLRDITNEIELNKQLKYSETKYKTLIENLNTPIFIIDKENYNIIETNFSAEIKLGLPLNKIKKMNLIELIKPDYINKFKNYAQNKTKTEDDKIEIEFVNSYNDFMIFDTVARNIKIYDKSYIQVICYDITENYLLSQNLIKSYNQLKDTQKNMIRAERLAAAGELAAGVSHEIKNRFQVISNALSYIEKKINMQEQGVKVNINYIKSEVKRGVELINDLMDFSKPHSLSKSMININEIIKSCFPLIKKQLEKKNIYYNENLGIIPNTFADYNMLQQVVMNIMKNAEESMIESGELSVTTECVHRNDINTIFDFENKSVYEKYIMIKIKDTGLGISEKNITKIFTPFFSTKDEAKGTGLGLSVSNSIIEEHNGFIDVESKQGQGTCFYIYLPVTENYED